MIWRDAHCCRCFLLSTFNPTRSFDKQCSKHRCQTWAKQLLNSHTPLTPKWSQFTDIGKKYGTVVSFRASSEEELFSRDEDKPIQFKEDPVLAWCPSIEPLSDQERDVMIRSPSTSKARLKEGTSQETRRQSVSLPLQFLATFKANRITTKNRRRDFRVKMKRGQKYSLVANDEKSVKNLQEENSSSDDLTDDTF